MTEVILGIALAGVVICGSAQASVATANIAGPEASITVSN